jgi:hypothetical protein
MHWAAANAVHSGGVGATRACAASATLLSYAADAIAAATMFAALGALSQAQSPSRSFMVCSHLRSIYRAAAKHFLGIHLASFRHIRGQLFPSIKQKILMRRNTLASVWPGCRHLAQLGGMRHCRELPLDLYALKYGGNVTCATVEFSAIAQDAMARKWL